MNYLLILTAWIELGAGAVLLCVPSAATELLLGSALGTPVAAVLGRVAGAALLALGVACWAARRDKRSPAARGLVAGMLLYNVVVAALFIIAGLGQGLIGAALWPAVILHALLAAWCGAVMKFRKADSKMEPTTRPGAT